MARNIQTDERDAISSMMSVLEQLSIAGSQLQDGPLIKEAQPEDVSYLNSIAIPEQPKSVKDIIKEAYEIFDYRMRMNHPKLFAFIPSPVSPFSWLGETLATFFNTFAGCKFEGCGPSAIENALLKWLASRVGLPDTAGGVFVSGGSIANLTAMVLARDYKLSRGEEQKGIAYVSDQTHSSIHRALRILGFTTRQIRVIPTNSAFQLPPERLANAMANDRERGLIPFIVVATCGTTNTGSIDPLEEIAEICHRQDVWMHVDGAYGASASLSATRPGIVDGLQHADSISWDGHKWLFQTYGCSFLLVKEKSRLLDSFAMDAEYLRDVTHEDDVPNFWNYGIELTRPARAMKLWFTLRVLGVDEMGNMIDQGFKLAEKAEKELRQLEDWEVTSPASLAIVTFRFAPPGKQHNDLDALNVQISRRLLAENIAGILTTKLCGKVVLRICSIHPSLMEQDIDVIISQVDAVARKVLMESA